MSETGKFIFWERKIVSGLRGCEGEENFLGLEKRKVSELGIEF